MQKKYFRHLLVLSVAKPYLNVILSRRCWCVFDFAMSTKVCGTGSFSGTSAAPAHQDELYIFRGPPPRLVGYCDRGRWASRTIGRSLKSVPVAFTFIYYHFHDGSSRFEHAGLAKGIKVG